MAASSSTPPSNPDWSSLTLQNVMSSAVPTGAALSPAASLLSDLASSTDWQQTLATHVAAVTADAVANMKTEVTNLQIAGTAQTNDLNQGVADIQTQITAIQDAARLAANPPKLVPAQDSFQLGVKLVDEQSNGGLPGLTVRLFSTRSPDTTVATTITDASGNALFKIASAEAQKLSASHGRLGVAVVGASGNSLHTAAQNVAPAANQTEGMFISLPASDDTAASLDLANLQSAAQQSQITDLNAQIDALKAYYQQKQTQIQQRTQYLQSLITQLTPPASTSS